MRSLFRTPPCPPWVPPPALPPSSSSSSSSSSPRMLSDESRPHSILHRLHHLLQTSGLLAYAIDHQNRSASFSVLHFMNPAPARRALILGPPRLRLTHQHRAQNSSIPLLFRQRTGQARQTTAKVSQNWRRTKKGKRDENDRTKNLCSFSPTSSLAFCLNCSARPSQGDLLRNSVASDSCSSSPIQSNPNQSGGRTHGDEASMKSSLRSLNKHKRQTSELASFTLKPKDSRLPSLPIGTRISSIASSFSTWRIPPRPPVGLSC
ncbi:hypothetical protein MPTK1_2g07440 [Marchantia polymorpha subsp. ruderalis]|uniref:Uncharacterized protein n=1 Tax=Marchantia polymorpha TaxID=3197 RepID=A0A2R6XGJ8_MARPO|nr:hypothetical protein MARPO_0015s0030 [Marchantia polymorpha]BBN01447.1 hypothetical protein Mp_2g07440 [Marchantia polymorpha subsp. ruderalis]|eukprot:PTQ45214.1 hypothetical protein MARPO_0015s0030 [Marchantia polymorpha]